jgi:hypothetical protein
MKKRKFNDGGMPDYEREPDFDDKAQQYAAVADYKVEKGMNPNLNEDMTFKEAFAAARSGGDKSFTWRGKKYTTELASSKPKASVKTEQKFSASKAIGAKPAKKAPDFMRSAMGMKAGGTVSSASKRGDGCAIKGKTRGRMV